MPPVIVYYGSWMHYHIVISRHTHAYQCHNSELLLLLMVVFFGDVWEGQSNLSRGVGRAVQHQRKLWSKSCSASVRFATKIRVHTYMYVCSYSSTFTTAVTVVFSAQRVERSQLLAFRMTSTLRHNANVLGIARAGNCPGRR